MMLVVQFTLPLLKVAHGHLPLCLLPGIIAAAVTHGTTAATFSASHVYSDEEKMARREAIFIFIFIII